MTIVTDSFFLISWAGVFFGCAMAVGVTRYRRRVRPVTFRRRRRVIVPGLLVVAAGLICAAVFLDGYTLVTWWPWSVALVVVPAVLVGCALGVPGGRMVMPVRLGLLALLIVPGLVVSRTWDMAGAPVPDELVTFRIDPAPSGDELIWSDGTGADLTLPAGTGVEVGAELLFRAEPLWWMRPSEVVARVVMHAGEQTRDLIPRDLLSRNAVEHSAGMAGAYARVDAVLREHGLIYDVTVTGTIPSQSNRFLQPGRYVIVIDGSGAHSPVLKYRYSEQ